MTEADTWQQLAEGLLSAYGTPQPAAGGADDTRGSGNGSGRRTGTAESAMSLGRIRSRPDGGGGGYLPPDPHPAGPPGNSRGLEDPTLGAGWGRGCPLKREWRVCRCTQHAVMHDGHHTPWVKLPLLNSNSAKKVPGSFGEVWRKLYVCRRNLI